MMKKYREWAKKPYTRGDVVKQYKWALIIGVIGEILVWAWFYEDAIRCWITSLKLRFSRKKNENDLFEDEA